MKATASSEFLKAHAVISRSWVMSKIMSRSSGHTGENGLPSWISGVPSLVTHLAATRDVCADDHCQRYQGLSRETGGSARKAVDATWGEVLTFGGGICDARFSKCCGGVTEEFSTCWEDRNVPYLSSVRDVPEHGPSQAFCDTSDTEVLSQVLNDYDLETTDFFRWTVSYGVRELSDLVARRSGHDIGMVRALIPEHRGPSGRIDRLGIVGTKGTLIVGKELEIRRVLSESHLKSSAFEVEYFDSVGMKVPSKAVEQAAREMSSAGKMSAAADVERIELHGSGWGHGVGLCQIGAAVMASRGYGYREILSHYYTGASVADVTGEIAPDGRNGQGK